MVSSALIPGSPMLGGVGEEQHGNGTEIEGELVELRPAEVERGELVDAEHDGEGEDVEEEEAKDAALAEHQEAEEVKRELNPGGEPPFHGQ